MTPEDLSLRTTTYALVVELGRVPEATDVAAASGRSPEEVVAAWRRLHEQHALVLDGTGTRIRMANPFSAVPTAHRVRAGGRWWYANCAWDAFGICAALGADGRVETSCPDCLEPMAADVIDGRPADPDGGMVFHCLVPARHWWEDIGFT